MYSSDSQWLQLEPLLKPPRGNRHGGGRPRKYKLRRVADALLYVVKTGCQWRQLPADFPPWLSVHQQFRAWRDDGTWERVTRTLREQGRKRHIAVDTQGNLLAVVVHSAGIKDGVGARAPC
jgi:transposase